MQGVRCKRCSLSPIESGAFTGGGRRVPRLLVVDDEEIIHRLLREGLQRHGIEDVLFARDGLEALEAMEGAAPPWTP